MSNSKKTRSRHFRTLPRRALYRRCKRLLQRLIGPGASISAARIQSTIRKLLRNKNRTYLIKLLRQQAFALTVVSGLFTGAQAHALPPIELSQIAAGLGGFVINGNDYADRSGRSVSGAGDVNGDGLDDVIVGVPLGNPGNPVRGGAGENYVVFGKLDGAPVELTSIAAGTGGFVINGIDLGDRAGWSVSGAGDVNGDGFDDLLVGAIWADPDGRQNAGESYVVFGKLDGAPVELTSITAGTGGFVINGIDPIGNSGGSVSGAGDVNGDGLDDLIIGAPFAGFRVSHPHYAYSRPGKSYVVFGKASGDAVELRDIEAGTGGFLISGVDNGDSSGGSVSGAGDVNGDGLADLVIGAPRASPYSISPLGPSEGESYVVFGKADGTPVELSNVTAGTGGFAIIGADRLDLSGWSVSGAGDVNGDGLDDLIIGAPRAYGGPNLAKTGESYVVFGKANGDLVKLSDVAMSGNSGGFVMNGVDADDYSGWSVSGAGDVNGDGLDDLVIGAPGNVNGFGLGLGPGESYVVFGKADGMAVELTKITAGTAGFIIKGIDETRGISGLSVSGAGDVNGDGLDDLIIGAPETTVIENLAAGKSYVVFGMIPPPPPSTVWVDFANTGTEDGTEAMPFDTLLEAGAAVADNGTINIMGDTTLNSSAETIFINKPMNLNAINGPVAVGRP